MGEIQNRMIKRVVGYYLEANGKVIAVWNESSEPQDTEDNEDDGEKKLDEFIRQFERKNKSDGR